MSDPTRDSFHTTPLYDLHLELGGRLVPFAGYSMPVQYEGVVAEHNHTRSAASLFDVSHMGIVELRGDAEHVGSELEKVLPSAIKTLKPGRQRYSFLTNARGGVIDDLMITRTNVDPGAPYVAVLNASRKHVDIDHLRANLESVEIVYRDDLALIALQGPRAVEVLARLNPAVAETKFMDVVVVELDGLECAVSRSGYTGEDGCEITVAGDEAEHLARVLLAMPEVRPAGLGARDTLRLEAGLCLYGHELTEDVTPVEADLVWAMQKRRREEGGFIGADIIQAQLANGVGRVRVGLRPTGRRPVRDGSILTDADAESAGIVTSGGFGPTIDAPVAMGLVRSDLAEIGTTLDADVRGRTEQVIVTELPFVQQRYAR
ncbi:MAG: glycine cleavage system aminomethyltransferase GcvT [Actinomycetia bacterium]|nr:glycine cleavage system aminomethyltransferase GcvT [Actinomycetes bacterium]MCP4960197.1 glycine cleavage system aminomethyltransferase GcvT [Actinomycetes bacterium]